MPSSGLLQLTRRHDRPTPRYTSYPSAAAFREDIGDREYQQRLAAINDPARGPLSLYVHIPFCRERCHFCACSVIATPRDDKVVEPYLEHLERELALVADRLPRRRTLAQMHWGGGTPTYLSPDQIRRLAASVARYFTFTDTAEVSVEVDPRVTTPEHLAALRDAGFGRISLGVQDLDDKVQAAIGRHQTWEQTEATLREARDLGFGNSNIDLVYGLPGQSTASFQATVDAVIAFRPERIAVYGYAHMPGARSNQRQLARTLRPDTDARMALAALGRRRFQDSGYHAIGLDHFVLPDDDLAVAAENNRLQRNFMGYTVIQSQDLLGIGVTSIGDVGGTYIQSTKKLSVYYAQLRAGRFAIERGYARTRDDEARRYVINQLMCNLRVNRERTAASHGIGDFDAYFADAMLQLRALEEDDLIRDSGVELRVTARGRPFLRTIAHCFDGTAAGRTAATRSI
ncbi:MAG: oxygen-independent coproporphyrinogen III oxidase [Nannocystaceae bacterium]